MAYNQVGDRPSVIQVSNHCLSYSTHNSQTIVAEEIWFLRSISDLITFMVTINVHINITLTDDKGHQDPHPQMNDSMHTVYGVLRLSAAFWVKLQTISHDKGFVLILKNDYSVYNLLSYGLTRRLRAISPEKYYNDKLT